ncbi:MAG: sugar ABC transporter substrate-binding protein [Anaerolinea sp.]|nr:sugar ABC transporter substrate-binding protein [Anaerolinea sp.]MCC6974037.1 sugar ABC transporter substrate-binding protein [Anaerolineae bacterium]CAG0997164.1 Ribose import binding protein RbsB [Anaerolineae bacterium]
MNSKRLMGLFLAVGAVVLLGLVFVLTRSNNAQKTHRISFVAPGFTSPFHVAAVDGAKAAAQKLGWEIEVTAPESEGDFSGGVEVVEKALASGAEALIVNQIQIEAMVNSVKAANAKNIPISMYNFITPLSEGQPTAYIGYDQWGGAEKLGIYTCQLLAQKYKTTPEKATGKIYILTGIDSIYSHRRTQGYKAGLALCPAVEIVGEQQADWLRTKGEVVATTVLQSTPDIDLFYANSDEMAIGAVQAGEKLGLKVNVDFFAIAIDGNQPTLDLIKAGKFTATLGVYPSRIGQTAVEVTDRILRGETVPQYILTPSTIVDASNLDAYIEGTTWTEPLAGAPELDNGKPTVEKSTVSTPEATSSN